MAPSIVPWYRLASVFISGCTTVCDIKEDAMQLLKFVGLASLAMIVGMRCGSSEEQEGDPAAQEPNH